MIDSNETLFFYVIEVKVSDRDGQTKRIIIERLFKDFLYLESTILDYFLKIYDHQKQSTIPTFKKIKIDDYSNEASYVQAKIKILDEYLQSFIQSPRFIIIDVVDFLEIDDTFRHHFLNYSQYLETIEKYKKKKKFTINLELTRINNDSHNNDYSAKSGSYVSPIGAKTSKAFI